MNRRAEALERLRNYEAMRTAVENLRAQIRWLKLKRESVTAVCTDRVAVCRSGSRKDDRLVDSLHRTQELEEALENTLRWLLVTDRALGTLDKDELLILRRLYIKKEPSAVSRLCQILDVEKSSVYRKRDKALAKFTTALFGAESKEEIGA